MNKRIDIIKKLNKELIKDILIKLDNNNIGEERINKERVLKEYKEINKIKEDSIKRIKSIRLWRSYNENNNRIYNWNNNNMINVLNKDNVVKLWIKNILNSKIKSLIGVKNKNIINNKNNMDNMFEIYSSEPLFLHTNDMLNIYIRILIPRKIDNKRMSKHYNKIISLLLGINNIESKGLNKSNIDNKNILTIINKLYNKRVNIIPVFIRSKAVGMNEFIIGSDKIYSPYKYNIIMNKLNKYIISKSNIVKNRYINKNSLYNMIYYNNINNILITNNINILESEIFINKIKTILPNINNRYITGYKLHYAGKLPKADSSSRTIKYNTMIGSLHCPGGSNNTISKTLYSYNNNGLASVKATICQGPTNI